MLNRYARVFVTKVFLPVAKLLLKIGMKPDFVTILGTLGVVFGSFFFYASGDLLWGSVVIALSACLDSLDGSMARISGKESKWGAFLDSTLDRVADSAIFIGIILWFGGDGASYILVILSTVCLALGNLVSYVKARAEGLGMQASTGIAERADRLLLVLLAAGLVGFGLTLQILVVVLSFLAVLSFYTVLQRVLFVRAQISVG